MYKNFACLFLILNTLLLTACNEGSNENNNTSSAKTALKSVSAPKTTPNITWSKLIISQSSQRISRDENIHVRFSQAIIDDTKVGKSAKGIISVKPRIKGKAVFNSSSEIIFVPDEPLPSNQHFTVTLQPNDIKGLSASDSPYQFEFSVIPMEYELKIDALQIDAENENSMQLNGTALFSDRVDADKVKELLVAKHQDKPLNIVWQADESGRHYRFSIGQIKRETYASDIQLSWNGKPLGIENSGERNITIPAINEFKVIDIVRVVPSTDKPYIQITLSEKHNQSQNLKGLIRLEPIPDSKNPAPKPVPFKISSEGNKIKLFAKDGTTGKFNVAIEKGLQSSKGNSLAKKINKTIEFETLKPGIRFVGKGHILPDNQTLEIPFEAANVNAVQVTAFVINPDNLAQFFQVNKLSGENQLGRVGRHLWRKTITLNAANPAVWNRYTFDASELLRSFPGALFRLELSIDRRFSEYKCPANTVKTKVVDQPIQNNEDINVVENSGWDGIEEYVDNIDYNWQWENRNKPCTDAYFQFEENPVKDSRNFIASNIGLLAKQDGHGKLLIVATDLKTSKPLANVELEIQNFQHQPLALTKTNAEGIAEIKLDATPFLLIAQKDDQKAYLKLNGSTALAISHFDVGGDKVKKGLKGIIYGERGVWRPGDDIHLTFVLQDKEDTIPESHPVSMQLFNPSGRLVQSLTNTSPVGDFYAFKLTTDEDAETGKWLVKAKLGGNTFSKTITIETVRPNRLKIDLDFGTETLLGYEQLPQGKLFSQWLHGGNAGGLKTDISVRFREKKTSFERFTNYMFDDPARSLDSEDQKILEGRLGDDGSLVFSKQFAPKSRSAGMLSAWFTSRVFEQGGAFSTSKQFMDYHPYKNYVGIKLPKGDASRNMLLTDQPHTVEIASLNALGEPSSLERVQLTLYKVDWKWWWDKSPESLAAFSNANHSRKLQQAIVKTTNGRGNWNFSIKYPDWGRYLIRACDLEGKHCAGQTVYVDWPGWAGRAQEQSSSAASTLSLFSDKKSYTVGETAIVQLPEASQGRALVTVENGSDILSQQWVEFKPQPAKKTDSESPDDADKSAKSTKRQQIEIPITQGMAPNVYVNVTLLQPHQNKQNDRPIRLLGIIPLTVTDPATRLQPQIAAADEWKPLSTQTVEVSEANGQAMDYTLAMVDEGLLGLTRYKTPDLHKHFYSKEALGIKSWDLFDDVVGAYGGKLERLLALGGGDDVQIDDAANRPKRFPPVVKFLGPFHLEKGKNQIHELELPAYIGAVRLMLVAGEKAAYGQTEKSVFVRQPLIMLPSLPRVLSVNEEAIIPVTLFSTKDEIKDVQLSVKVDELIDAGTEQESTVSFNKTGDKLGFLRIKAGSKTGKTHLHFVATSTTASGQEYRSESDVYLDIRQPNTESNWLTTHTIEPGETGSYSIATHGIEGSNSAVMEVSTAPPLGLEKHLDYLVKYPHGCLEQTTSSAFPQLYLSKLLNTGAEREKKITHHVSRAIDRIRSYQNNDGNLNYWPGGNDQNAWSSLYAGHFLIEAQQAGYQVPPALLSDWLRYQSGSAQRWLVGEKNYAYVQAYRLYILALAGKPELGAMNRFRENKSSNIDIKAKWLLAAAYKLAGQDDAAKDVSKGLVADPDTETEKHANTYSTHLSDLGIQLNALSTLGKKQDAEHFVKAIAQELNANSSNHNTHGISWALMAVSRYISGQDGTAVNTEFALNDDPFTKISSKKAYYAQELGELKEDLKLKIKNTTATKLYASLISKGIPAAGDENEVSAGLELKTSYSRPDTQESIDLTSPISQGQDIQIRISVHNTSGVALENIALSHLVPSGLEIHNAQYRHNSKMDYQDVRDDRIYTYFSLKDDETRHFTVLVNPAYPGRYYLPAISAEAMYQPNIQARVKGGWINVQRSEY